MKKEDLEYNYLIKIIKEIIPERGKLTNILMDLLFIEKEAVYRRLRGEVPFTFSEVVIIAKEFNISLDNLVGTRSIKNLPLHLKMTEYINPTEEDYLMHEEFVDVLKVTRKGLYSELGFVTSIPPLHFFAGYPAVYRFYMLKWAYQFGSPGTAKCYADIALQERFIKLTNEFLNEIENITYTYVVWDELTFHYLVNDIKYFESINLISQEDIQLIKSELSGMLDHLEKLANTGCYDNGNKIQFYVSNLNFETTYTYMETSDFYLTLIKTFTLNEVASLDKEVFHKMKTWIQALKRTSVLISESGEVQRLAFFDKQRECVERL